MGKRVIGSGQYSIKTYEQAASKGYAVRTSRGGQADARRMHRDNLAKFAAEGAVNADERTITDVRNLNPFRGNSYAGIVDALLSLFEPKDAKALVGKFSQDYSAILEWSGLDNDGIKATRWVTGQRLFDIACRMNDDLLKSLKSRKNKAKGVKNRITDPSVKFISNIGVIQRTGGITPYAMPLMRCKMAIDSQWVLCKGEPVQQFRLVVGRSEPQVKGKRALNAELCESIED